MAEEFDHEIYTQSEVLDNLEQTLEGQTFPWDLSGSGEGCTLMVSWKKAQAYGNMKKHCSNYSLNLEFNNVMNISMCHIDYSQRVG